METAEQRPFPKVIPDAAERALRMKFDLFRHLTTLSAGSMLLLVAFLHRGAPQSATSGMGWLGVGLFGLVSCVLVGGWGMHSVSRILESNAELERALEWFSYSEQEVDRATEEMRKRRSTVAALREAIKDRQVYHDLSVSNVQQNIDQMSRAKQHHESAFLLAGIVFLGSYIALGVFLLQNLTSQG